jgi:hypothetical protein
LPPKAGDSRKKEVKIEVYTNWVVMGRGSQKKPGRKLFIFEKEG